jgi:hypothetical protein
MATWLAVTTCRIPLVGGVMQAQQLFSYLVFSSYFLDSKHFKQFQISEVLHLFFNEDQLLNPSVFLFSTNF